MQVNVYAPGKFNSQISIHPDTTVADILKKTNLGGRVFIGNQKLSMDSRLDSQWLDSPLVVLDESYSHLSDEQLVQPLMVYLRNASGRCLKVETRLIKNISSLKKHLSEKYPLEVSAWNFVLKGKDIDNDASLLLEHDITNNSIIHVLDKINEPSREILIVFAKEKKKEALIVEENDTIADVKKAIEVKLGIRVEYQILVFCGGELTNDKTVKESKIVKGSQLFLVDSRSQENETRAEWLKHKVIQEDKPSPKRVLTYEEHQERPHINIVQKNSIIDQLYSLPSPIINLTSLVSTDKESSSERKNEEFSSQEMKVLPMATFPQIQNITKRADSIQVTIKEEEVQGGVHFFEKGCVATSEDVEASKHQNPLAKARVQQHPEQTEIIIKQTNSQIIQGGTVEPGQLCDEQLHCKHVESIIEKSDNTQKQSGLDDDDLTGNSSRVTQSLRPKKSKNNEHEVTSTSRSNGQTKQNLNQSMEVPPSNPSD